MNLYFLVEGMTEKKVYPSWIRARIPELTEVRRADQVVDNHFYFFSSGGFPSILRDIPTAVEEINEIGRYDYFAIVLDADECSVEERAREVQEVFIDEQLFLYRAKPILFVQNRCFETWCLGNRSLYPKHYKHKPWKPCQGYYNCHKHDPEQMIRDPQNGRCRTISQYHAHYLKQLFAANQMPYFKGRRAVEMVGNPDFLHQLYQRIDETKHLRSLQIFLSFLNQVAKEMTRNHS